MVFNLYAQGAPTRVRANVVYEWVSESLSMRCHWATAVAGTVRLITRMATPTLGCDVTWRAALPAERTFRRRKAKLSMKCSVAEIEEAWQCYRFARCVTRFESRSHTFLLHVWPFCHYVVSEQYTHSIDPRSMGGRGWTCFPVHIVQ
jgi:hypothetical protein